MKNVVSGLKLTKKYGQPKVQWTEKLTSKKKKNSREGAETD